MPRCSGKALSHCQSVQGLQDLLPPDLELAGGGQGSYGQFLNSASQMDLLCPELSRKDSGEREEKVVNKTIRAKWEGDAAPRQQCLNVQSGFYKRLCWNHTRDTKVHSPAKSPASPHSSRIVTGLRPFPRETNPSKTLIRWCCYNLKGE